MGTRSVSFLLIGCGSIGRRHAANLRALNAGEIWLYDSDHDRVRALVGEQGARAYFSLDEAWGKQPDVVLVCGPTSLHLDLARQAVLRGCDVFVEKPLAHREEGLDDFIELVRDRRRVVMVGHNLRFKPAFVQARRWIETDRIGRVVNARFHYGSYLPLRHPWEDYRQGYAARQHLGGGVILDAIHEIDAAQLVLGAPDWVFCAAAHASSLEMDTEDLAEISLAYEDGRSATVHLDYLERPHQRWCHFIGERGTVHCDLVAGSARLFDAEVGKWSEFNPDVDPNHEYLAELQHFLECRAARTQPTVDPNEAARSVRLAFALKQSAAERSVLPFRDAGRCAEH